MVYRLMKKNNLLVKADLKLKAKRTTTTKPRATGVNEWRGIDMTKVMIDGL